jgi:hypothetical protein
MSKVYMLNVGYCNSSFTDDDHIGVMRDLVILDNIYKRSIKNNERIKTVFLNSTDNVNLLAEYLEKFYKIIQANYNKSPNEKQIFIMNVECHSVRTENGTIFLLGTENTKFDDFDPAIFSISEYATIIINFNSCEVNYGVDGHISNLVEKGISSGKSVLIINESIKTFIEEMNNENESYQSEKLDNIPRETLLAYNISIMENKITENKNVTYPIIKLGNLKTTLYKDTNLNQENPGTFLVEMLNNILTKEIYISYADLLIELNRKLTSIHKYTQMSKPYIEVIVNTKCPSFCTVENWLKNNHQLSYIAFKESVRY